MLLLQIAMLDKFSEAIRGDLQFVEREKLTALVTIEVQRHIFTTIQSVSSQLQQTCFFFKLFKPFFSPLFSAFSQSAVHWIWLATIATCTHRQPQAGLSTKMTRSCHLSRPDTNPLPSLSEVLPQVNTTLPQ